MGKFENIMAADELERRAIRLEPRHWRLLNLMKDEPVALKKGGQMARAAWELQQVAFAWPKRSPWWTITQHGRKALELRPSLFKSEVGTQVQLGEEKPS